MTTFAEILENQFPGSLRDSEYVDRSAALLAPLGFTGDNTIACAATCRDEICRPLRTTINDVWGEAFNFSSLAGMLTLGRTGFGAFHAHAPTDYDKRRHVYYAMPHIGIEANGELGATTRRGISKTSKACGALFAFAAELEEGWFDPPLDMHDIEQSLVKKRLLNRLTKGDSPDPAALVRLAEQVIREDLLHEIQATVDPEQVDYAVFTGIQIHGPDREDYVFPVSSAVWINGESQSLTV
jgi:hypothetical protein